MVVKLFVLIVFLGLPLFGSMNISKNGIYDVNACINGEKYNSTSDDWDSSSGTTSSDNGAYIRSLITDSDDSNITVFYPKLESYDARLYDLGRYSYAAIGSDDFEFGAMVSISILGERDYLYFSHNSTCLRADIPQYTYESPDKSLTAVRGEMNISAVTFNRILQKKTIRVENLGSEALNLGEITLDGDDFRMADSTECIPNATELAEGSYCGIAIEFHPNFYEDSEGSLTVYTDSGENRTILLRGVLQEENETEPVDTENSDGNQSDDDHCFIATAAYGSIMEPDVVILRKFRDDYLLSGVVPYGEEFVGVYYKYSPPVAQVISKNTLLKTIVRGVLFPLILFIKQPWFLLVFILSVIVFIMRRKKLAKQNI